MKFVLVYRGPLPSHQGSKQRKKSARIEIRKQIGPQLEELWATSATLKRLRRTAIVQKHGESLMMPDSPFKPLDIDAPNVFLHPNEVNLTDPITRLGNDYVPLIRSDLHLTCSLDILFLRAGDPGKVRDTDGDIDNRIKCFLDALEVPTLDAKITDGDETEGANYRLYENDALVRGLNINTERLLLPDTEYSNVVHIVAEVVVHVERVGSWNICLL